MGNNAKILAIVVSGWAASAAAQTNVIATPAPPRARIPKVKKPKIDYALPKGVRMIRVSPVFAQPKAKAKVLADVDADTVLIARAVSPNGAWLQVEDEEGNRGWVPMSRTNFNELFAPEAEAPAAEPPPNATEIDEARKKWEAENAPPKAPRPHLHFVSAQGGAIGGGASYTFLQRLASPSERTGFMGVQLGGYRFWDFDAADRTYAAYLKFRWLGQDAKSSLVSGPDLGVVMRLPKRNWAGTIGYAWGWVPNLAQGSFALILRPGVEIGGPSRFGLELEAGWLF